MKKRQYKLITVSWEYFVWENNKSVKTKKWTRLNYSVVMIDGIVIRVFNQVKVYDNPKIKINYYISYNSLPETSEIFNHIKTKCETLYATSTPEDTVKFDQMLKAYNSEI